MLFAFFFGTQKLPLINFYPCFICFVYKYFAVMMKRRNVVRDTMRLFFFCVESFYFLVFSLPLFHYYYFYYLKYSLLLCSVFFELWLFDFFFFFLSIFQSVSWFLFFIHFLLYIIRSIIYSLNVNVF